MGRNLLLALLGGVIAFTGCGDDDGPVGETPTQASATPTATETATATPSPTPEITEAPTGSLLKLQGVVPSDGAMAIPRFPNIQLAFSEAIPEGHEGAISAHLAGPEGEIALEIDSGSEVAGDAYLAYLPASPLDVDSVYTLHVSVDEIPGFGATDWPLTLSSSFSTEVPCGVTFNIATDITIHALGGNQRLVALLQEILEATTLAPIALMFLETRTDLTFPAADMTLVSGLPVRADDIYAPDPVYGYPVSVDECQVDGDGALDCARTKFVFPIPITSDTVIYLAISDAQLSGQIGESGAFEEMSEFYVEGVITEEDLIIALEAAGLPQLIDYIELDVDTDQDGFFDSASAAASSHPSWLDIEACDVTGAP